MLKKFFTADWQSESVEKRLSAVADLDWSNPDEQAILKQLIAEDDASSVRHAALKKVPDPVLLFQFVQQHSNPQTGEFAQQCLLKLIGPDSRFSIDEFRIMISDCSELTTPIALNCPHAELRSELLGALSSAQQAELIASIHYAETRKWLAESLDSEGDLQTARNLLRGKDKSTEKILKSRLNALHAAQKTELANQKTIIKLCETMETLACKNYWHKDIKNRFLITEQRWNALDFEVDQDIDKRFKAAHLTVKEHISKHELEEAQRISHAEMIENMEKQCKQISTQHLTDLLSTESSIMDQLKRHKELWADLTGSVRPSAEMHERYLRAKLAIESALQFIDSYPPVTAQKDAVIESEPEKIKLWEKDIHTRLNNLHWPKAFSSLQAESDAEDDLQLLENLIGELHDNQQNALDRLHKRINRVQSSIKRGNVSLAKRELSAIRKLLEKYSGKDRTGLDKRLEKATDAVEKMSDWKDFATEPKFIDLCKQMEKLTESKMRPDRLAKQIKKLQEQWKALGHSESADKHWEQFKLAADRAYEPCAKFFDERKIRYEKNLALREKFVIQLNNLLENTDWDNVKDYKPIESELRSTFNSWKKIKEVAPKAGKKQWQRFTKIRDQLYEKLESEYIENLELKKELLGKAQALLDSDLQDDALNKLQYLQKSWKAVGITRRKDDQKIWKKFKAATDDVFEKIKGIRNAKRAAEDKELDAYRGIIKQIQSLSKTARDLSASDAEYEKLTSEYKSLPPLPKNLPEKLLLGIEKDFKRACSFYQRTHEKLVEKGKNQSWDTLAKKADMCSQLEAMEQNSAEASRLLEQIQELEIGDTELTRCFKQRLENLGLTDRSEYSALRRRLCIDLEILMGKESPEEDKSLRRQIQLERMQSSGLGHPNDDKKTVLNRIKRDWYCLPGAEPEIQAQLYARYRKLIR